MKLQNYKDGEIYKIKGKFIFISNGVSSDLFNTLQELVNSFYVPVKKTTKRKSIAKK